MVYLLIRHPVESYTKWKPLYDADAENRKKAGSLGAQLMRSVQNENELVVITTWPDVQSARAFVESEALKKTMEEAGVVGAPEIVYLEEVETTPA